MSEILTYPKHRGNLCFQVGGKIVNKFLSGWTEIDGRPLVNMLRLRFGTLGAIDGAPSQPTCHNCDEGSLATLAHIINDCPGSRGLQIKRHNSTLELIFENLDKKGWTVLREESIRVGQSYVKPDLIVVNHETHGALVLDIQISYETSISTLDMHDLAKREKYRRHSSAIISHLSTRGYPVRKLDFYELIFGSRGAIHNVSLNILKKFGFADNWITGLITKIMYQSKTIFDICGPTRPTPNGTRQWRPP